MNRRFYGQWHEDYVLAEIFTDQETGFYVDVGAYDGIYLSNTYRLELNGWTGICIEAHPHYAELCRENRPNSTCLHGACVGDATADRVTFYAEKGGLFSSLIDDDTAARRHYQVGFGISFDGFQTIEVPAMTLDSVLADVDRAIDLVSIDVEGSELGVLVGFNLEKHQPRILLIEANTPRAGDDTDRYLNRFDYYRAGRAGVNNFYCARADTAWPIIAEITASRICSVQKRNRTWRQS